MQLDHLGIITTFKIKVSDKSKLSAMLKICVPWGCV